MSYVGMDILGSLGLPHTCHLATVIRLLECIPVVWHFTALGKAMQKCAFTQGQVLIHAICGKAD